MLKRVFALLVATRAHPGGRLEGPAIPSVDRRRGVGCQPVRPKLQALVGGCTAVFGLLLVPRSATKPI